MEEQVLFLLKEEACFVEEDNLTPKVCKYKLSIIPIYLIYIDLILKIKFKLIIYKRIIYITNHLLYQRLVINLYKFYTYILFHNNYF